MENPPMTMPDWPKLWAREPSLKPEGLVHSGDCYYSDYAYDEGEGGGYVGPPIAAALCRDAAVRFLAARGKFLNFDPPGDKYPLVASGKWDVVMGPYNGDLCPYIDGSPGYDTPDEALFANVDAVLTAEGKGASC